MARSTLRAGFPTCLLTLVGLTLPLFASERPIHTLDLASYNVQFVTPVLPWPASALREWPGHAPNVTARAHAIAARLACFDVVALQETVNDRRRAEIFAALEVSGRACSKPSRLPSGAMFTMVDGPAVPDSVWLPVVGDELALASRLPIEAEHELVFAETAGTDALAAKGALHARLAAPAGSIDVYVTHLQANAEHGPVRRHQIDQLAGFVASTAADPSEPIVVMGDFNVWGGAPDRADPDSEYRHLVRSLARAVAPRSLLDLWLATHPYDPETGSGTKPRVLADGSIRPREKRIDHVFLATTPGVRPLAMRRDFLTSDLDVDGRPLGHLSDHAALLATIAWQRATADLAPVAAVGSRWEADQRRR